MEDLERLQRLRQNQDWFRPAMDSRGPLAQCLDEVLKLQDAKIQFIQCLKKNLCTNNASVSDRVTELRQLLYDFSRTLDMRLGVLSFDRPAAWFRSCANQDLGPFPGRIHRDPVFLKFDPLQAKVLKVELKTAWYERRCEVRSFDKTQGTCLWLTLLAYNQRWERLCELPEPYADLRLDELPEAMPDELYSDSLQAFLLRVKGAVQSCRSDLDRCFDQLWKASDPFLAKQFTDACQRQNNSANQSRDSYGQSRFYTASEGGYRHRATLRLKRLRESLAFMDFEDLPSRDELKKRYRLLARQYHPDFDGGSEEQFKSLTRHYREILHWLDHSSEHFV